MLITLFFIFFVLIHKFLPGLLQPENFATDHGVAVDQVFDYIYFYFVPISSFDMIEIHRHPITAGKSFFDISKGESEIRKTEGMTFANIKRNSHGVFG